MMEEVEVVKNTLGKRIYKNGKLYMALVAMILVGTIDAILYVRLTHKMEHYEWFLSQVAVSLGFLSLIVPIVMFRMFVSKSITQEMRKFPKKIFFFLACLDGLAMLIGTIPAPYIPGPFLGVFMESDIPFSFVGSIIYLGARYTILHGLSAVMIISALLINIIPFVKDEGWGSGHLFWGLIVIIAAIPSVCSNLFKEKNLKKWNMDVWYFNAWIAFFQLLVGVTTIWSEMIPFPKPATHISPEQMTSYLQDATMCFFNMEGRGNSHSPFNVFINGDDEENPCSGTLIIFGVFVVFNVASNALILYVYKNGSVTMAVISGTCILVLSNLGFHVKPLAGLAYTSGISIFNLISLWIIVCSIILYNIDDEKRKPSFSYDDSFIDGGGSSSILDTMETTKLGTCIPDEDEDDDYYDDDIDIEIQVLSENNKPHDGDDDDDDDVCNPFVDADKEKTLDSSDLRKFNDGGKHKEDIEMQDFSKKQK